MCGRLFAMLKTSTRLLQLLTLLQTPAILVRRRAGPGAGRDHPDRAQRRRPAARSRLSGARVAGRGRRLPAGRRAPSCRRCCSTTTRRWRWPSAWPAPPPARSAGIEETSLRALAKLEQVMPARVRRRFQTVQQAIVAMPRSRAVGRRARPDHHRRRLPRQRAAALRLPQPRRRAARCATPSRTAWSTTAAAGTWWPGTAIAPTGARSASIAWRCGRRSARAFVPRPPPDGDRGRTRLPRRRTRRPGSLRASVRVHAPAAELAASPAGVDRRRGHRRPHLPGPRGLRLAGDAGQLPGDAGRRLRGRRSARAARPPARAGGALPARRGRGHWWAIATRKRSSGEIRWSWSSSPRSSCTQAMSPLKALPRGPVVGGGRRAGVVAHVAGLVGGVAHRDGALDAALCPPPCRRRTASPRRPWPPRRRRS